MNHCRDAATADPCFFFSASRVWYTFMDRMKTKTKRPNPVPRIMHHASSDIPCVRLPDFWAALTFLAFPTGWILASWLGYVPMAAFTLGAAAMMAILVANRIAEQELWFFDAKWRERLEHPDVSFRLAVVTGALLLIVETTLLVLFFTDGGMDRALLDLVFFRQCQNPSGIFEGLCESAAPWLPNL